MPNAPTPASDRRRRALALSLVTGIGPVKSRELAARHGSLAAAFDAEIEGDRAAAALSAADGVLRDASGAGIALVLPGETAYPATLADLPDPPARLFALGDPASARRPAVAIVGTREATGYGLRIAADLAAAFASAGATVVSGMARGIDAAAHRAALEASGRTVAVLGTGADVPYPPAHRGLHAEIAARGLVLSEELPGARSRPGSFPRRNRIIAGLADLTVVVEAGRKSGALITAAVALDLGRSVAAVPGSIFAATSTGANELIRDGAAAIASIEDALALLSLSGMGPAQALPSPPALGASADAVWTALAHGPLDVDTLAERTRLSAPDCLTAITTLELAGIVRAEPSGELVRV